MPHEENKFTISIFGKDHSFDLDSIFESTNIPKTISKFLLLHSEAIYQLKQIEDEFKIKRSEFLMAKVKKNPGLPEWKFKIAFASTDEFKSYSEAIARAERTANRLSAIILGLKAKNA